MLLSRRPLARPVSRNRPAALPEIRLVWAPADAERLGRELCDQKLVSVDTEWYNYDKDRQPVKNGLAACMQFAWKDRTNNLLQRAFVFNFGPRSEGCIYALNDFWASDVPKTAHNAPSDAHIILNHGIKLNGLNRDTMVADYLVDENREDQHDLKTCIRDHAGKYRKTYAETFGEPRLKQDGTPYASGERVLHPMEEVCSNLDKWQDILIDYAVSDAEDGLWLYEFYKAKLEAVPWVADKTMWDYFLDVECAITDIIVEMEREGMPLDLTYLREKAIEAALDLEMLGARATEWARCPMNIGSKVQLAKLLYGRGLQPVMKGSSKTKVAFYIEGKGWPVLRTTEGGGPSTKSEHLKELKLHLVKKNKELVLLGKPEIATEEDLAGLDNVLNINARSTQKGTFIDGTIEKALAQRIHCRINQIGTTSGRFSSAGPNLQNISTGEKDIYHIRDCFCAPPGYLLIVADYAQLEYRLLAHFSQEPKLIKLFQEGWDLHSLTAYNIYPQIKAACVERFGPELTTAALKWVAEEFVDLRKRAKTLNFEIIYGVGYKKLADQLGIDQDDAKNMINGWFNGYPYVRAYMDRTLAGYREKGWQRTLAGRYRHAIMWMLLNDDYGIKGAHERTLTNAGIQGSASDVAKRAMIKLRGSQPLRELGYRMTMQVHDEIIGFAPKQYCDEAITIMRPLMEHPFTRDLRVALPISIGKGPTWATAKA